MIHYPVTSYTCMLVRDLFINRAAIFKQHKTMWQIILHILQQYQPLQNRPTYSPVHWHLNESKKPGFPIAKHFEFPQHSLLFLQTS